MLWVGYTLLSAFSLATTDALTKKSLGDAHEAAEIYLAAWARLLYAAVPLALLLLIIPIPPLDAVFWRTMLLMAPLELLALVLYVKALQASPLSVTQPLLSLTPLLLVVVAWLMLDERPTAVGLLGIVCVVAGTFLLQAQAWREGFWRPLRALWRERGARLMMGAAAIYSVTSSLGKQAILHSSALFFGIVYFLVLSAVFLPAVLAVAGPAGLTKIWRREFVTIGLFQSIMMISHVLAIAQANVAYMIAVKRTSMLFSLFYGGWWFGERHLAQRWAGALMMLVGVALTVAG